MSASCILWISQGVQRTWCRYICAGAEAKCALATTRMLALAVLLQGGSQIADCAGSQRNDDAGVQSCCCCTGAGEQLLAP